MSYIVGAPDMTVGNEFERYLVSRMAIAHKAGLWCCPDCGIIGRLTHRYMAPYPKPRPNESGKCNPDYIARLKRHTGYVEGDGI